MSTLRTPAMGPLLDIVKTLETGGVPCALGASGLLAALDLVNVVNDWDLSCDADARDVQTKLLRRAPVLHGNSGCHADHKLTFVPERIEVICRFAFFVPGGVVNVPTRVTRRWRGVPVGSPEGWAVAYALLGMFDEAAQRPRRAERSELLFGWLERNGADAGRVDELLREPQPLPLAARLRALPRH